MWTNLTKRTQQYTDLDDCRGFYKALKAVYRLTHRVQSPLRSADGQVFFADKASILSRWSEYFQSLFSGDLVVQNPAVLCIPQQPFKAELDKLLSMKKITKARQQKSTGFHQSSRKKVDQHYTVSSTNSLSVVGSRANFQVISAMQSLSPCTKRRGEKSDCSNYRGITRLSIAGKILACVLLKRLILTIVEDHLSETYCWFRAHRGTTDMMFILRQLQEKCWEQNKGLYVVFVDLIKVLDTVSRKGLWIIMEHLGCPPKHAQRPALPN